MGILDDLDKIADRLNDYSDDVILYNYIVKTSLQSVDYSSKDIVYHRSSEETDDRKISCCPICKSSKYTKFDESLGICYLCRRKEFNIFRKSSTVIFPKIFMSIGTTYPKKERIGGWAVLLEYNNHEKIISGSSIDIQNSEQIPLFALQASLKALKRACDITLILHGYGEINKINQMRFDHFRGQNFYNLWTDIIILAKEHKFTIQKENMSGFRKKRVRDALNAIVGIHK